MSRAHPFAATLALLLAAPAHAGGPETMLEAEPVTAFPLTEANQAVAVDADAIYAVDNRTIVKLDKRTHQLVRKWESPKGGPIQHFDSATVVDGKLYLAHSNYPDWPMASSVEIFDAATLRPVATHSFGIQIGSFTWLDRGPDGFWYGGFANYNRVFDKSPIAYGNKFNTQVVRFDADWRPAEQWTLPDDLVKTFGDMSNSGGSFGPDGKLWITGHDNAEAYRLEKPEMGPVMRWTATVPLPIAGQGIAWDRSEPGMLYGIVRGEKEGDNRVSVARVALGDGKPAVVGEAGAGQATAP